MTKGSFDWKTPVIWYLIFIVMFWILFRMLAGEYDFFNQIESLSMISGYVAFLFIGLTLIIGPMQRWLPQGRFRSFVLRGRRYAGITAGLLAIIHVITVLKIYEEGPGYILFRGQREGVQGWWTLFVSRGIEGDLFIAPFFTTIANYMGLFAFIWLMILLFTSSNRAQNTLGSSAWNRIHSGNMLIFIVVMFHALLYVTNIKGSPHGYGDFFYFVIIVLLIRWITFGRAVAKMKFRG